jgi:hypothetical protein
MAAGVELEFQKDPKGHEGRFPPIRLRADYRFRNETIA